ncbi:MAG: tRNA dihydrouridine(20/20a) synthase DusA [Gammaproteobacteria bacterium]|nr:tRNA dihydrouridine(20/20a) synthase DusA [Gammaproteobacteria bacterium]
MWQISVAPMMDWTDTHCRTFLRCVSQHTRLYTEMITANAILHGDQTRLLNYHPDEKPLALQVGGSDPKLLKECARLAESLGFDEINLNVGCPSDRVQMGMIGLCLMAHPDLVAECVAEMKSVCRIPVTVKTRIGFDHTDDFESLCRFVEKLIHAHVDHVMIHARKGWLSGLSPKENRTIPPLRYDVVYQLKKAFPRLNLGINGGIESFASIVEHLKHVDGVMIGRAAYHNPYLLANVDAQLFQSQMPIPTRREILLKMIPYLTERVAQGTPVHHITRHMLGLYHGEPGGKKWRQELCQKRNLAEVCQLFEDSP